MQSGQSKKDQINVEEYLSNINSIAFKISLDINAVKLSLDNKWDTLSSSEKVYTINKLLIKPTIKWLYFDKFSSSLEALNDDFIKACDDSKDSIEQLELNYQSIEKYFLKLRNTKSIASRKQESCLGLSQNDIDVYCDEHSFPFSFKTKSQNDLQLLNKDKPLKLLKQESGDEMSKVPNVSLLNDTKKNYSKYESQKDTYQPDIGSNSYESQTIGAIIMNNTTGNEAECTEDSLAYSKSYIVAPVSEKLKIFLENNISSEKKFDFLNNW